MGIKILIFWVRVFVGVIVVNNSFVVACPLPDFNIYTEEQIRKAEFENKVDSEKYRWLYAELIPENLRIELPEETFKSFRVHLLDSFKSFPKSKELQKNKLKKFDQKTLIEGNIKYVEIFPKKYRMDIYSEKKNLIITVKVHFKNANTVDLDQLKNHFKDAEKIWNQKLFKTDIPFVFRFHVVSTEEESHFSVKLLDDTRGPYDMYWSRSWPSNVVAHELGHMLGLGDEYQTLTGKFDCMVPFLMCGAWYGQLQPMHQYFVLRRLIQ